MIIVSWSCSSGSFEILGKTEKLFIQSIHVEDEFTIYIALPPNYPQTARKYPLIIGLDGDNEFEPMAGIVSQAIEEEGIPPAIFVGIGYGSEAANDQKRNRDYTPSKTQGVEDFETGGAEAFYQFMVKELIPELETRYQIDSGNTKTLMGHSYGGLFTLYALFQKRKTNPFDKFIPVAASFWYDSGVIFEYEAQYALEQPDLPVALYTAMGSLEGTVMVASFEEMNERLTMRAYPNLNFFYDLLHGYGHSRSDYVSYEKGLRYVYGK